MVKIELGYAWAESRYGINYIPGKSPRLTIEIPTSGRGGTIWPWYIISSDRRMQIIKAQLDNADNIFVRWNYAFMITQIVAFRHWD